MKNINKFNVAMVALAMLLGVGQVRAFDFFGLNKNSEAPLREGFTCCNLHYEGDWISDSNFGALPFIPAGARIKLKDYGRHRLHVDIDDKPMRIGLDYGRAQETLEQFAEKLILAEDPKAKIVKYPAEVREAIRFGQVVAGMTQEQTIIAVGYPQRDETVSLEVPVWNYWASSFAPYRVVWGKNGRIKEIVTDPATQARMVYRKAE